MGTVNIFHSLYAWLYTCVVQAADPNWFCVAVAPIFLFAGISSHEDTAIGRAPKYQLYSFVIEVWFHANG